MKRFRTLAATGLAAGALLLARGSGSAAESPEASGPPRVGEATGGPGATARPGVTIALDRSSLEDGGTIVARGTAPVGKTTSSATSTRRSS